MSRTADAFDCPSFAVMTSLVSKFLGKMTASSSPALKKFSAPYLKYAYPSNETDENVIKPYLTILHRCPKQMSLLFAMGDTS